MLREVGLIAAEDTRHTRTLLELTEARFIEGQRPTLLGALRAFGLSGLRDLTRGHLAPRSFTFWDYREGAHRRGRGMRIDHLLGTPDVAARVRAAGVDAEERGRDKPSDHAPVWVQLG